MGTRTAEVPPLELIGQRAGGAAPAPISWRAVIGPLVLLDGLVALMAAALAVTARFHDSGVGVEYRLLVLLLPPAWVVTMAACRSYDRRFLAVGSEEFGRVVNGGLWLFAAVALVSYISHTDLSREAVGVTIPLVTLLTLLGRLAARRTIHRAVQGGRALSRVVVVGARPDVVDLVRHLRRVPKAGVGIVGACIDSGRGSIDAWGGAIPVLGRIEDAASVAALAGADTIAVAGTAALTSGAVRRLSWKLERTGIDLIVAPAITDMAGPRIVVRPVNGLPLLHVDRPAFRGLERVVKAVMDRAVAAVLLLLLSPVLAAVAAAVRLSSPGPALFRQERIGQDGRPFSIVKFRTMRVDAEAARGQLDHLNELDGPLFKIRRDPRLTPIGRWLRRFSLDELPQLLNVLNGTMSLVGPRPALRAEVDRYGDDALRRLLVKPGITGLWQVSGRSDLTWDESVRLDLFYVDHRSIALDCVLLCRTVVAVLAGRGAY